MTLLILSKYEETFNGSLHEFPIMPEGTFYSDKPEGIMVDGNLDYGQHGIFRLNYCDNMEEAKHLYFHTYFGCGSFIWGDRDMGEDTCFLFGTAWVEKILETNEDFIFHAGDVKERIWGRFESIGCIKITFSSLYNECGTIWGTPVGAVSPIIIGSGWKIKLLEFCEPVYLGN